jgi:hypothetical protein
MQRCTSPTNTTNAPPPAGKRENPLPADRRTPPARPRARLTVLDEANVLGVLAEALAANVHAVLADQTTLVGADAAAGGEGNRDYEMGEERGVLGGGGGRGSVKWIYYSPLARALAILLGVGVPDGVVTHDYGLTGGAL